MATAMFGLALGEFSDVAYLELFYAFSLDYFHG